MTPEERARKVEFCGRNVITEEIRQARREALEEAAAYLDKEAASYERVGDKMGKQGKSDVADQAYNSGGLYEHAAEAIRALMEKDGG